MDPAQDPAPAGAGAADLAPVALIEFDALPRGRGRRVCRAGFDLALFRVGEAVYALDDSCPHAGASLANGRLDGERVVCPAHGLKFDLRPGCGDATRLQARSHRVRVVDGVVVLDPSEPEPPLPKGNP